MTEPELTLEIERCVEDYLALKQRVLRVMHEIAKHKGFEYFRSLEFIAYSMIIVDKCIERRAPTHFMEHLSNNMEDVISAFRNNCVDDDLDWPEEISTLDQ